MEVMHTIIHCIVAAICLILLASMYLIMKKRHETGRLLQEARKGYDDAKNNLASKLANSDAFVFWITEKNEVNFSDRFYNVAQIRKRSIPLHVLLRLVQEDDRDMLFDALHHHSEDGLNVDFSIYVPFTGKLHTIRTHINNITKDGQPFCMGLVFLSSDMNTDARQREEVVAMERKTNVKASFLASMGHELRTPLNAIVGFSQIISQQYEYLSDEDRKSFCEIIQQNNEQLLNLLDSVSEADGGNNDKLQLVLSRKRVADLMEELYLSHTVIVPKHLELRYNRGSEDDFIMVNRGSMLQVVSNLMNNAIKFTQEGSITLGWESDADNVTIFVEDTGIGIRKDNLAKLFDKFFKESSTSSGAGFGLSLCQRLVTKMNGKIQVKSEYGKGSRFEVLFQKA